MELDELKKSWNALNEHLKDKKLVSDEEINKLINHAGKTISAISRLNIKVIIISIPILILCLIENFINGTFGGFYIIIFVAAVPGFCWDIFTTRYLQKTRIAEMPLVDVVSRINRYNRWIIRERIIGIAFILLLAIVFLIDRRIWEGGIEMILLFIVSWGAGIGLLLWIYQSKILGRIKEIKKNLDELKELM